MATVSRFLVSEGSLDPGESKHTWWNHAPATTGVYALSVWPVIAFQNNPYIDKQAAEAEIRNVRHNYKKAIANVQSSELEIHYEIHNLCDHRIDYHVYMAAID
jgi:hypothetical protein